MNANTTETGRASKNVTTPRFRIVKLEERIAPSYLTGTAACGTVQTTNGSGGGMTGTCFVNNKYTLGVSC